MQSKSQIENLIQKTKSIKLLYVEDDPTICSETVQVLNIFFKDISISKNAKEAINILKNERHDAVITDIKMPELDGTAMIKEIKKINIDMPIIVISGLNTKENFISCIQLGVLNYVFKPFSVNRLMDIIEKILYVTIRQTKQREYRTNLKDKLREYQKELKLKNDVLTHKTRLSEKGEMLDYIAHQWRQPLNRINSNIAVINSLLHDNYIDSNIFKEKIKNIQKNIQYMSNTIADFTEFSSSEKRLTNFIVNKCIDDACHLIGLQAEDILIDVSIKKNLNLVSYENEYVQILLILLQNSIDNFHITSADSPKIAINAFNEQGKHHLIIKDNGGGIKEKFIDKIFDPYFTTKAGNNGYGLGLYIVKMLIEESLKGTISVNNIDNGVCFEIVIEELNI